MLPSQLCPLCELILAACRIHLFPHFYELAFQISLLGGEFRGGDIVVDTP
jgi:hypothetical protein